jgi:hypothetical protein
MKELDTPVTIRFIPIHAGEEDDTENYYLFISEQIQYQLRYARNPFILYMNTAESAPICALQLFQSSIIQTVCVILTTLLQKTNC